ncbi:hypothetical protein DFH06DRAFT_1475484 [Mycena polygramma]|nr:hypothetical protein DFH06DRAFT_1475484 [Mycena polygramma]
MLSFVCLPVFGRLCGTAGRGDGDARNRTRVEAGGQKDVVISEPRPTSMLNVGAALALVKSSVAVELAVAPVTTHLAAISTKVLIPAADDPAPRLPDAKDEDLVVRSQPDGFKSVQNGRRPLGSITNKPGLRVHGKPLSFKRRSLREKENDAKIQQRAPRRPRRRPSAHAAQSHASPRAQPASTVAPAVVGATAAPESKRRSVPCPPVSAPASALRPSASAPELAYRGPPPPAAAPAPTPPSSARPPSLPAPARVSSLPPGVTSSPLALRAVFQGLINMPDWPRLVEAAGLDYTGDDDSANISDAQIAAFFNSREWLLIEEYLEIESPMPIRDSTINRVEVAPEVKNTQRWEEEDVFWSPPPTAPSSSPARSPPAPARGSSPPPNPTSSPRALRAAFEELVALPHWSWLLEETGTSYTPDDRFEEFTDADIAAFFDAPQWLEMSTYLEPPVPRKGSIVDRVDKAKDEQEDDGHAHWSDVVNLDSYAFGAWAVGEEEEGEDVWPDYVPVNYGE